MAHRNRIKTPPILRPGASQEARRQRALEEQRKNRALRIDAARNIDLFAGLSLSERGADGDDSSSEDESNVLPPTSMGVARFLAQMDQPSPNKLEDSSHLNGTPGSTQSPVKLPKPKTTPSKSKPKAKRSKQRKATKWADKCMYAELLEMRDSDHPWDDGLPKDLEREWVALAPIPKGKRCIAVSFAPSLSGPDEPVATLQANTALHSRVKGLAFMRFPAPLPPDTVLDCILDDDVASTGILYVLDVIRWRGTDVAQCEADFRFWFRDARLAELAPQPEPTRMITGSRPYPHQFLGVPYYLPPLTTTVFLEQIIPAAQSTPQALTDMEMDTGEAVTGGTKSDGILLYVREAAYTPGETPLSCWIPAAPLDAAVDDEPPLQSFKRLVERRASGSDMMQ
ncbi:snupn protein [Rhizoctonia solani AG-3 Rhs1AP]|uniref:Snurportin-1 n=1 Tax=Rhizoctonia solani AG-3 Rhs1AP TaxID=1086054 RepID=X8JBU6_9AGAM|nr:snupn protein [Rhizoctonia solani AG-3 Rhs1AP]